MKLVCPKNAAHKKFFVTAHVTEEWIVDENSDWLATVESGSCDVVHRPDSEDLYTCETCGAEAKKKD